LYSFNAIYLVLYLGNLPCSNVVRLMHTKKRESPADVKAVQQQCVYESP